MQCGGRLARRSQRQRPSVWVTRTSPRNRRVAGGAYGSTRGTPAPRLRRRRRHHWPSAATASASLRSRACRVAAVGTQLGKGTVWSWCRPRGVWSSCSAARSSCANHGASLTTAGQRRRSPYVTLPPTRRQTSTSRAARMLLVSENIWCRFGWLRQLPRMGSPATASAKLGTTPRAPSRTTPWWWTNAKASVGVMLGVRVMVSAAW